MNPGNRSKRFALTMALMTAFLSTLPAQAPPKRKTMAQLATALSEAYVAKSLGKLDAERALRGTLKLVIEHSLGEANTPGRFETKRFQTFAQSEAWLRNRERDNRNLSRASRPLLKCQRGSCAFDFEGGLLHNHLYLQKISYGYQNQRPYIKTIYLLDGD